MDSNLNQIKKEVYDKCSLEMSELKLESESIEYNACRFRLNGLSIISRKAKITPKKAGQFVTCWKRKGNGPIEPFSKKDRIDFYTVNVRTDIAFGQFAFYHFSQRQTSPVLAPSMSCA